ncbi:MIF-like protein mif-2 [Saccostrea echinata]|uniref:MIF-like protein mif-2 n=1 Tax=Saccostrea echinata TaxID=191078 RepID=UPI002A82A0C2|nr:MIF-like protein mif-2 [Saccostrea echinata]
MPMVFLYTNLKDEEVPADFEVKTSRCVSEVLNKPKERIHVILNSDKRMCRNEDSSPCVLIEIQSLGVFSADKNPGYTEKFMEFFSTTLSIPKSRVTLVYKAAEAHMIGIL